MIFLIYVGLQSKTLNETIRTLLRVFYQKVSVFLSQGVPYFCSFCLPVFTACHFSAGESISLTASQARILSSQRREGCAARRTLATAAACLSSAPPRWARWHGPVPQHLHKCHLGTAATPVSVTLFLLETGLGHGLHHPSACVNMVTVSSH